jgi:hypothetical protein
VGLAEGLDIHGVASYRLKGVSSAGLTALHAKFKVALQGFDGKGALHCTLSVMIALDGEAFDSQPVTNGPSRADRGLTGQRRGWMQNIAELERRITAALERIGVGIDRVAARPVAPVAPVTGQEALLRAQLEEERAVSAQLKERMAALTERAAKAAERAAEVKPVHVPVAQAQLEARIDKMTRQLDVQGLELQRMRKITIQLREQLARMREAAEAGATDPHLINKAMLAELEALRATRQVEIAEMDEILAELSPLIGEVQAHA